MKNTFCLLLLMLVSGYAANAQTDKNSLLWQINGNGLQQPSYIFGSFHIMCKADFQISAILAGKIRISKQFFGELDMSDPTLQQQMISKMMLQGNTLQSLMGETEYTKVSAQFLQIAGVSLAMFNNFKPFMPLSILVINSIPCKEKIQPETEFVNLAQKYQIPIRGLESVDEEINAIDQVPLDSQINSLKQSVLNFDSVKTVMLKMQAVYNLRNTDSLYSFVKGESKGGDLETELLVKRNLKWIPIIRKAMADKASFFVVGAGHLGGPEGVIRLLQKQGYKVTPVTY